jgi:hypothetical protein
MGVIWRSTRLYDFIPFNPTLESCSGSMEITVESAVLLTDEQFPNIVTAPTWLRLRYIEGDVIVMPLTTAVRMPV